LLLLCVAGQVAILIINYSSINIPKPIIQCFQSNVKLNFFFNYPIIPFVKLTITNFLTIVQAMISPAAAAAATATTTSTTAGTSVVGATSVKTEWKHECGAMLTSIGKDTASLHVVVCLLSSRY
jgi:hypothetical protein